MIYVRLFVSPVINHYFKIPRGIKRYVKCAYGLPIRCGKESMDQLLFLIHYKHPATDERDAQDGQFVPYKRGNTFQVASLAHGGYLGTPPVERGLLYGFLRI